MSEIGERARSWLALLLLTACGTPQAPHRDAVADSLALEAQYERFAAAYPVMDTATIIAMYEDSAAYLYGGRDIQLGRQAIGRGFSFLGRARAAGLTAQIGFNPVRREFHDGVAWSVSNYLVAFTRGVDTVSVSRGTALVVWRKDSTGTWRIAADAFAALPEARRAVADTATPVDGR